MMEKLKSMIPLCLREWLVTWMEYRKLGDAETASQLIGAKTSENWPRIASVISSPDNEKIPRGPDAGKLDGAVITMANGVKVSAHSLFGEMFMNMLMENRGVHEPQEEYAFGEVLNLLEGPGTMLELGAYWSFYSLSYLQANPESRCFMIEPTFSRKAAGRYNFRLNGRKGTFVSAMVGAKDINPVPGFVKPWVSVDGFCRKHKIDRLQVLHCDIDGGEEDMLAGAERMLSEGRVDFLFIGTHSPELHDACLRELRRHGYQVMISVDLDQSFSYDGFIAARNPSVPGPETINVSMKGE